MGVVPNYSLERWRRVSVLLAAALIVGAAIRDAAGASRDARPRPECPADGARVVSFARAVDGGGFVTADDEEVRLSGILAFGAGGETASADEAAAARDALERALRNRTVSLAPAELTRDRYGRSVAQVFADGTWVQGALLRAGEVRAAPDLTSAPCAKALLAAEDEARRRRLGHWRTAFRVQSPGQLRSSTGSLAARGHSRSSRATSSPRPSQEGAPSSTSGRTTVPTSR
jgi:endonuclease YncB( thermonuclease family)